MHPRTILKFLKMVQAWIDSSQFKIPSIDYRNTSAWHRSLEAWGTATRHSACFPLCWCLIAVSDSRQLYVCLNFALIKCGLVLGLPAKASIFSVNRDVFCSSIFLTSTVGVVTSGVCVAGSRSSVWFAGGWTSVDCCWLGFEMASEWRRKNASATFWKRFFVPSELLKEAI